MQLREPGDSEWDEQFEVEHDEERREREDTELQAPEVADDEPGFVNPLVASLWR